MIDQDIDMLNQQRAAFNRSEGLSSTPNYIQSQNLQLDRLEFKIDELLMILKNKEDEI